VKTRGISNWPSYYKYRSHTTATVPNHTKQKGTKQEMENHQLQIAPHKIFTGNENYYLMPQTEAKI
jgi:hypothetical protein